LQRTLATAADAISATMPWRQAVVVADLGMLSSSETKLLTAAADRYAVLSPNLLGSCYGTRFVAKGAASITTRDQARLVALLLDDLGISRVVLATGGSLGGMVALEWAATFPERSETVAVFAAPAAHTAWGIGWNHVMRRAIAVAGVDGLALARMAGMLVYRTPGELEARFGRSEVEGGELAVRSYLDHHGEKLVARFDDASYVALLDAMDAHDVGRGRGSVGEALSVSAWRLTSSGRYSWRRPLPA
jgi:homoserine O-acetyltransferase